MGKVAERSVVESVALEPDRLELTEDLFVEVVLNVDTVCVESWDFLRTDQEACFLSCGEVPSSMMRIGILVWLQEADGDEGPLSLDS